MKITRGIKTKPRNILLYGEHGTGKTTLAATFPNPVMVDVEGGSDDIDVARTDRVKDYDGFKSVMNDLAVQDHDFRTICVDSIDWLERLITHQLAVRAGKNSIDDFGFGRGYTMLAEEFDQVIRDIRLLNNRGIACILISHAKAVQYTSPGASSFDRWEPDLHKKVQGTILEFCDEVLFLKRRTFTTEEKLGFNKTRNVVVGTEERVLVCCDTGSVVAKNRLQMPNEIEATFANYASYVMAARARASVQPAPEQAGDIDGIVNNGSSRIPFESNSEAGQELAETTVF